MVTYQVSLNAPAPEIQDFWDVAPYRWVNNSPTFRGTFWPWRWRFTIF